MKKKGDLYIASEEIEGVEYPLFFYAKLATDQYLIILDSIFHKDPIKRRYAIVSQRKFLRSAEGKKMQKL